MIAPDEPFLHFVKKRWIPPEMTTAPALDPSEPANGIEPHYALLINPFYAKDANASFGKHVLTPTLALTSFAATTPAHWRVDYWDENLLDGCPSSRPMPQVVGITVHLTFAKRAFDLADWYRSRGSKVILGGLHVLSCPEECVPHADALALGDGVQLWPRILRDIESNTLQPRYVATYENDYCDDPPPRRSILPRRSFLTTTSLIATRGCHNRCGFCYLATDGLRMPYRMRHPKQVVDEFLADNQPYAVFIDNNLGSRRDYLHSLCAALRPLDKIWSAAVTIDVTDDPSLIRNMALAGCTGVFIGFESLSDHNLADSQKKPPKTSDSGRRVRILHDHGIQVNGSFVLGFDHDRKDVFARTAEWIEENRLECAPFHILTPNPASRLDALRHRPRRLPTEAYDARRTRTGLRVDLPALVFARVHLAPATQSRNVERFAGRAALPRHVLPLQTFEPLLAPPDQTRPGEPRVEAAGRDDALAACGLSQAPRRTGCNGPSTRRCARTSCIGGRLKPEAKRSPLNVKESLKKSLTIYTVSYIVYATYYMANGTTGGPEILENLKMELRRGCLIVAVLAQRRSEQYGYALRKALADDGLAIDEGTLYPLLRRLETQGLLVSQWREQDKRNKRFYRLSPAGELILTQLLAGGESINASLNKILQQA